MAFFGLFKTNLEKISELYEQQKNIFNDEIVINENVKSLNIYQLTKNAKENNERFHQYKEKVSSYVEHNNKIKQLQKQVLPLMQEYKEKVINNNLKISSPKDIISNFKNIDSNLNDYQSMLTNYKEDYDIKLDKYNVLLEYNKSPYKSVEYYSKENINKTKNWFEFNEKYEEVKNNNNNILKWIKQFNKLNDNFEDKDLQYFIENKIKYLKMSKRVLENSLETDEIELISQSRVLLQSLLT